ncbi:hypothetical protein B0F90DRAFT_1629110 [Multifurca ochricompacta]|uniref:HIT-type domain-containing protein n=1 Tax=Multifurca ochricompacta TaxID=376703 RepID=A0AAD4M4G3_9AGAM|nr:hypothetical protein B0F90DRAFT_1629110 [Multifurca ochricompacta]
MPPKLRVKCQICSEKESRYICASCFLEYCSVPCYKQHKDDGKNGNEIVKEEVPLRPLTSLKWPYVPEESAYPDPLKRDDPKPLQMAQYETIATSPAVRAALTTHPILKDMLRSIDKLRGGAREEAIEASLGVSRSDLKRMRIGDDERRAMRELTEAIERAVRGEQQEGALGLDWCS